MDRNASQKPYGWKTILLNETGQMSIFIALIFQVLFVFFAMVINVGLLVHDKINLQNAVDLGAYYAAQKQAEVLNEIAHINYQIRQDYKLLAWRYHVLGTLGRQGSNTPSDQTLPPARKSNGGGLTDKAWKNPAYQDGNEEEHPSVCVANEMWDEMTERSPELENYCFRKYNQPVPLIPDVEVIAGFVPSVQESAGFTKEAQQQQQYSCRNAAVLNWAFTMQMIYAYKLSVGTRKTILWEMRKNLISKDIKDRKNESVREGVKNTILKNLTFGNRQGFDEQSFDVINGLAENQCAQADGEFLMPEIRTAPLLFYTYSDPNCQNYQMRGQAAVEGLDPGELQRWDPTNLMRNLAKAEPEPTSAFHSSLGFEKNPWCMAYMGVKAKTSTSKPFSPFGAPIELEARAFAQPFGGRIGPWYKERWSRSSPMSAQGDRLDKLTTPRMLPGGALDESKKLDRLPNYSRYPGDALGITSEITMGAQRHIFTGYASAGKGNKLKLAYYTGFDSIPEVGDPLAYNKQSGQQLNQFKLRQAEISAVTPDLFDATYYSVEPDVAQAYVAASNGPDRFQNVPALFGRKVRQIPDLGGRNDQEDLAKFNIQSQIKLSVQDGGLDQSIMGKLYYVVRQWEHLLTAWAPHRAMNFQFPSDRFGKCESPASEKLVIPGKCHVGGRTGYSVRLISRAYLMFQNWKIGGDGEAEGSILNPPKEDF